MHQHIFYYMMWIDMLQQFKTVLGYSNLCIYVKKELKSTNNNFERQTDGDSLGYMISWVYSCICEICHHIIHAGGHFDENQIFIAFSLNLLACKVFIEIYLSS